MRRMLLFAVIVFCAGCGVFKPTAKYQLSDGYYRAMGMGDVRKVYLHNQDDEVHIYPLPIAGKGQPIDTLKQRPVVYGQTEPENIAGTPVFVQGSFDIDFLTIPIKYRFPAEGFTRQLNANLNGGLYIGYRKDYYILHYDVSPIGISTRSTTHLGFSAGCYAGLGNTFISQYVTGSQVLPEYDGVVFNRGFAAIVALNHFTAGLALGWDRLLDKNRVYWIYNNRPWLGIVLGLNLN